MDKMVRVKEETYNKLKALGKFGESFDDIINKLMQKKR